MSSASRTPQTPPSTTDLGTSHRAVLSALRNGSRTWYRYDTLSTQLAYSRSTVEAALVDLDRQEMVEKRPDPQNGRKTQCRALSAAYSCPECSHKFDTALERAFHRLETHEVPTETLPLDSGEFVRLIARLGLFGTADELAWSIRKTTRVAGLYGLAEYIIGTADSPLAPESYDVPSLAATGDT